MGASVVTIALVYSVAETASAVGSNPHSPSIASGLIRRVINKSPTLATGGECAEASPATTGGQLVNHIG